MTQHEQQLVSFTNADLMPALAALNAYKEDQVGGLDEAAQETLGRDEKALRDSLGLYVEAVRHDALLGGRITATVANVEPIKEGLPKIEADLAEKASISGLFKLGPRQWATSRGELKRTRSLRSRLS